MFDDDFLEAVKNKNYFNFKTDDPKLDEFEWSRFFVRTKEKHLSWFEQQKRLIVYKLEKRPDLPIFARDIIQELKEIFPFNEISCQAFCTFGPEAKSFKIHKDAMDVLYLQVRGSVIWEMWEEIDKRLSADQPDQMFPDEGNCTFSEKLTPGDMIWVPRYSWHHAIPLETRVGFSFGVEGKRDASKSVLV